MKAYPKWFRYLYFGILFLINSGCTYSIIMNHTEGSATDLVDETQDASPDISPTVTLPLAP